MLWSFLLLSEVQRRWKLFQRWFGKNFLYFYLDWELVCLRIWIRSWNRVIIFKYLLILLRIEFINYLLICTLFIIQSFYQTVGKCFDRFHLKNVPHIRIFSFYSKAGHLYCNNVWTFGNLKERSSSSLLLILTDTKSASSISEKICYFT